MRSGSYSMPNLSAWDKLWKNCVSMGIKLGQTFPLGLVNEAKFAKMCKTCYFIHQQINKLSRIISTAINRWFTTVKNTVFHRFHITYYYEYESNLLFKGA